MTNVLYIHTHDTGRIIGPYGYRTPTPNIDAFFQGGVSFQRAYSAAPTCSPSRAALLTGCFPHQVGMLGLAQRGFEFDTEKHLARFMAALGFQTVLCGVQHEVGYYLDHDVAAGPLGYAVDLTKDHRSYEEADLVYWDAANADSLCEWLVTEAHGEPFFASYGLHATHREFPTTVGLGIDVDSSLPPPTILNRAESREDFARYLTSAKFADENIGRVLGALRDAGLAEDTIVILTTDHGAPFPFGKSTLSDAGTGVMLAMQVPGAKYRGPFDGLISHVDVFPTLCELLGVATPDHVSGVSFAELFTHGTYGGDEAVFAEMNFHTSYEPARSVRTDRWKYIRYFDPDHTKFNLSNIDRSPLKDFYLQHGLAELHKEPEQLYDTYYDPAERNNLIASLEHASVADRMRTLLREHMQRTDDPLSAGPIPIDARWRVNRADAIDPSSKNPDDYLSSGQAHPAKGDKE